MKRRNTEIAEADSTTDIKRQTLSNMDDSMDATSDQVDVKAVGGSTAHGVGVRGALKGNTSLHERYGAYYEEINELHSKKIKQFDLWYGMASNYGTGNPNNNNLVGANNASPWFAKQPAVQTTANNNVCFLPITNGIVATTTGGGMLSEQPFQTAVTAPDDAMQRQNSLSDAIVAAPINFCVDDLIDGKLLTNDGDGGLMIQYQKFRLLDFSIELTFKTIDRSSQTLSRAKTIASTNGAWQQVNDDVQTVTYNATETVDRTCTDETRNVDYWVYRDFYNDYASAADPTIPLNWFATNPLAAPATVDRRVRGMRNLDTYLTLTRNEEKFKFTRKINERASYYFTVQQLQLMKLRPLQYLVNLMEGIVPNNQDINPLQEGFNLLVAPTQCPMAYSARMWAKVGSTDQRYYMVTPGITTMVYAKIHATWKAFDFNYVTSNIMRALSEPEMTKMEQNYKDWIEMIQRQKAARFPDPYKYYGIKRQQNLNKHLKN